LLALSVIIAVSSIQLDCQFKTKWFGYVDDGESVSCVVKNLKVKWSAEVIEGVREGYEGNETVKGLVIRNQMEVHFFPSGIAEIFDSIEGIYIEGTQLKAIDKTNLQPFPALKELRIIRNYQLETLESGTFIFNTLLECIDFTGNNMQQIDCIILVTLTHLKVAFFNLNLPYINEEATTSNEIEALKSKFNESCQSDAMEITPELWILISIMIIELFFIIFI